VKATDYITFFGLRVVDIVRADVSMGDFVTMDL